MSQTTTSWLIKEALPNYEIGSELGRGAMGVVLAGHHRRLDRDVAIKQLPPAFASDQTVRERFGKEARTLAALAHPHIVPIYDYVEEEGLCLLVMEALPGGTLWTRFTTEGLTVVTACTAVLATCEALDFAHQKGVLHRDVKPDNLMFAADKTLKVTDFGIAEVFGGDETVTTVNGEVIGTPAYMAPEQAQGKPCGPQADVYAAGTVLYELLSGTLPLSIEGDAVEVLERRVKEEPTPLLEVAPQIPEPLAEVTMRAIQRDPDDRYATAGEFGVAIGDAATEAFGPGWVGRADLHLVLSGPIAAAAGPTLVDAGTQGARVTGDVSATTGRETMITGTGAPVPRDEPLRMRATAIARGGGVHLDEIRPEDLVRVDDLVTPPKFPWLVTAAAVVCFVALALVSALGIGTPSVGGPLQRGQALVAGVDVATDRTVDADLADDIPVRIRELPRGADNARYVRLGFSVLGVQLPPSRSGKLRLTSSGDLVAAIDAKRDRILWTGETSAHLRFLDARKRQLLEQDFHMDADRPFYMAFVGVFSLVLLAFVASYGWSLTQPVRRGFRRRTVYLSMAVLGIVTGGAILGLGWSIFGPQPTPWSVVVCLVLGGLGAVALAQALVINGRRQRLARAQARKEAAASN